MANNCYVEKYIKSINNENLLALGEGKIKIKNNSTAYYCSLKTLLPAGKTADPIKFSQAITYSVNGDTATSGTTIAIQTGIMHVDFQIPANTEITLSLPKYYLYELDTHRANVEVTFIGVNYTCLKMINLISNTVSGLSLDDLVSENLETLSGMSRNLHGGNIEKLSVSSVLKNVGIPNNNITGDIVTGLTNSKGIVTLEIQNTQISGSLNALFDAWAAAGKTGNMLLSFNGSNCTLTGVTTYADNKVTFSGGSWSVSQWS